MEKTYWNGTGTYEAEQETLHEIIDEKLVRKYHDGGMYWDGDKQARYDARIPSQQKGGSNYHLERLRKVKNAYYRLMNDGDKNKIFDDAAKRRERDPFFGYGKRLNKHYFSSYARLAERVMDERIKLAAEEQGVSLELTYLNLYEDVA
tara:strand:- start:153 stop:596 length:444 start_codon:yes stop_codon:yes gene_type:complete